MATSQSPISENVTAQAKTALSALAAAVADLRAQLNTLAGRKAVLVERRAVLYTTPLSPEDIGQCVGELIDLRADGYREALREKGWAGKLAEPRRGVGLGTAQLTLEDVETILGKQLEIPRRNDPVDKAALTIFPMFNEFDVAWVYFLLGDLMKEKLRATFLEFQSEGIRGSAQGNMPPVNERRQEIAAINAELQTLETEAARLSSEIRKLSSPVLSSAVSLKNAAEAA